MKHYDARDFLSFDTTSRTRLLSRLAGSPVVRHNSAANEVLRQAREAQNRADFYREALDVAAIVAVTDTRGTILSVNRRFCEISGYTAEELVGSNHRLLRSHVHDRAFFRDLYRTIARGEIWHGEICNRAKSGRLYWVDTTIVPHRGLDGKILSYTAIRFDITPQKTAEERLWRLANIDALTDLPNRLKFVQELGQLTDHPDNVEAGTVIALLDIDHFKDINDTLGHDAGDGLLNKIANRIREALPPGDVVARLGGDEFALILRDCPTRTEKEARVALILDTFRNPITLCGTERRITASIGATRFPEEGRTTGELLKNADIALYAAKEKGRDRAEMFSEQMRNGVQRRAELRSRFENGIGNGEFHVHYQPIVPIKGDTPVNMEALLRWKHPDRGLIHPPEFMEALRDEGLAALVDDFVLDTVIAQIQTWRRTGIPFGSVSVNATIGDFRTSAYVDKLLDATERGLIANTDICVEVTEDVVLGRGGGRACIEIERLHQVGIRIALDDFGTGFASLRHLRDLPIDMIKIDQSFIRSLETDENDRAVVASVIDLSHNLRKRVTAEGVETDAQQSILSVLGCDYVQGYRMARALSADDVSSFVLDRAAAAAA